MEFDIFFSICQTEVHGSMPSERKMFESVNRGKSPLRGSAARPHMRGESVSIENIRVILEQAGSSLEKVRDVTVYVTDMKRDFDRFNEVYGECFGKIQPTRTTVGVDSLPTPISVELKVIAAA